MEPSNFHSTVLQRPAAMHEYDEDRDRDERRRRDILNPVQLSENGPTVPSAGTSASPATSTQPPRHSFNLRSPTQSDFHHPPHFPGSSSASPSSAANAGAGANTGSANTTSNGTRSLLHNPFLTTTTAPPSLPPPVLPSTAAPPRSPLHAPAVFYPQDMRDPPREKTAGSFYDPTTDTTTTTKDRRVSETGSSWHNATQSQTSSSKVSIVTIDIDGLLNGINFSINESCTFATCPRHQLPSKKKSPSKKKKAANIRWIRVSDQDGKSRTKWSNPRTIFCSLQCINANQPKLFPADTTNHQWLSLAIMIISSTPKHHFVHHHWLPFID